MAVLVGDSHAGHDTEGFATAANEAGFDAVVVTNSACPFVDLELWRDGKRDEPCGQAVDQTLDDLVDLRPSIVAISSASASYIESPDYSMMGHGGEITNDPDDKAAVWSDALRSTVEPLSNAGIAVVVFQPTPGFAPDSPDPMRSSWLALQREAFVSVSKVEAEHNRARTLTAQNEALASTDAVSFDPLPLVCPDSECTKRRDRQWNYRDNGHLSVPASYGLADELVQLLSGVAVRPIATT